jgi:N-acetylglucosaminyldiphosphoundecaprenol N-acetyl-beta-D-mannosaminyltransferase
MPGKVSLLGTGVDAVDLNATLVTVQDLIEKKHKGYICLAPAHNLMACRADAKLKAIFNRSSLTVPDGMGTVWFLRLLGQQAGRVYGPDLMVAAAKRGESLGWRHFFLGGAPGVAERVIVRLQKYSPNLQVAGVLAPPFGAQNAEDLAAMVKQINASKADILWVALGSPRQEVWMAENRDKLKATVLIGVGAAFDFLSGAKPQAPVWMQRAGLEWLYRLLSEPRRLCRRYAAYPLFVLLALAQWLGLSHYPLKEAS